MIIMTTCNQYFFVKFMLCTNVIFLCHFFIYVSYFTLTYHILYSELQKGLCFTWTQIKKLLCTDQSQVYYILHELNAHCNLNYINYSG